MPQAVMLALLAALAVIAAGCPHDQLLSDGWRHALAVAPPLRAELATAATAPPVRHGRVRVATYNVHFGEHASRLAQAIASNARLGEVDVLLLQEMQDHPTERVSRSRRLASLLRMNFVYAPARRFGEGTHGPAVLSRFPIRHAQVMAIPRFDIGPRSEARVALWVTLDVDGVPLQVVDLHLDTRINPGDRLRQLRPAVELSPTQVVVGGDMNTNDIFWLFRRIPVAPAGHTRAVDRFMRRRGFRTPTDTSGPTTNMPLVRLRLDSIYTRDLEVRASGVERTVTVSDHLPVWVDIGWPPPSSRPASP